MLPERNVDLVTDSGKALKITDSDINWCTNCSVYLVVSTKVTSSYVIRGISTARKELINDQVTTKRSLSAQ